MCSRVSQSKRRRSSEVGIQPGHRRQIRNRWWIPSLLALAAGVAAVGAPRAQTETDREKLAELARQFEEDLEARRPPLYFQLLSAQTEPQRSFNRNPDLRLVSLDERGHPVFYGVDNLNAARTLNTDDVWPGGSAGHSLTGLGTQDADLGVWDAGGVLLTHQEMTGRVTQGDVPAGTHWHATHVAGTMIAGGVAAAAKGMSYQGRLSAYDWISDASEMATAGGNGMEVSNHSYGQLAGWSYDSFISAWVWWGDRTISTTEDYRFGYYDSSAQSWDQIAYNAPLYTIVKSAGNDRGEGPGSGTFHWHWDPTDPNNQNGWVWTNDFHEVDGGTDGYDCLPDKANAKNVLTVGAVADIPGGWSLPSSVVILGFSSRGPTDDGRIKPDLVANGDQLYSCSDLGNNQYATASGTSMATPNASGSINLLVRHFEATHGGTTPRAATVKALVIQTANEAGPQPGPDYIHGWGLLDTRGAADLIQADSAQGGRILEATLANGATDEYYFWKASSSETIRITLAWTDPAGSPPPASLNPTTSLLVNDLDVQVEQLRDGIVFVPWGLDPTNPGMAAFRTDNVRDNVERVDVGAGAPVDYYKVTVTHKGTLTSAQAYSLVSSHHLSTCLGWVDATTAPVSGGASTGASLAWGDYDKDGDHDLYIGLGGVANVLARNDGGGTFTDVTPSVLADQGTARGMAWGDYDNDADLDLFLANSGTGTCKLFRNDGGGSFTNVTSSIPVGGITNGEGLAWGDYDKDGFLDLYVASGGGTSKLFHNEGDGTFADSTQYPLNGNTLPANSAAWADYDNDSDLDLYLVRYGSSNMLFRNDGGGSFTDVSASPIDDAGPGRGAAWGDFDDDGDYDLYLANEGTANKLFRNNGDGSFTDVTSGPLGDTGQTQSVAWGDYDLDGDLDLILSNSVGGDKLLRNDRGGVFADATEGPLTSGSNGSGAGWADYDGDGDIDLYRAFENGFNRNQLTENGLCNGNHWLQVDLVGSGSNYGGIGARVRIVAGGRAQVREVSGSSGFLAQNSLTVEFGLGSATVDPLRDEDALVDTLQVYWPGGSVQEMTMVAVDQMITVTEPPPTLDLADHDVGNMVLSMTDLGVLGFLDASQLEGSGLIYPASGSNQLYIGGVWVAQCEEYIANRDYLADPAQEWIVASSPDGHVVVDYGGHSDQDIRSAYTDDGAESPRGVLVSQESWAWAADQDDDFVLVRIFLENRSDSVLTEMRVGIFLDLDLGSGATDDQGGTDPSRQLVYMKDVTGLHAGVALLEGDQAPDAVANLTLIHNPTYVWPDEYIPDADKLAFIAGSDPDHVVPSSPAAGDWSLLASAGPFDLDPGETNEVSFAVVAGASLAEIRAHADRAQLIFLPTTDAPDASLGETGGIVRLLPNQPNPFFPETLVGFELPGPARVRLDVFDPAGRRVRSLASGRFEAGRHSLRWDGRDNRGRRLGGGVYFLRLAGGGREDARRITLLK